MPSRAAQPPENFAIPDTASKGVEPTQQDSTSRFEKLMQDPRGKAYLAQASLSLLGSQHDRGGFGRQISDAAGAGGDAAGRVQTRQDTLSQLDTENEAAQARIGVQQQGADAQTSIAASQAQEVENRQSRAALKSETDVIAARMVLQLGLAKVDSSLIEVALKPMIEEAVFNADGDPAKLQASITAMQPLLQQIVTGKPPQTEAAKIAIRINADAKANREGAITEIVGLLGTDPVIAARRADEMVKQGLDPTLVALAKQRISGGG